MACLFAGITLPAAAAPGADGTHALSDKVAAARRTGVSFEEATLFAPATGAKHGALLEQETLLQPIDSRIAALYAAHPGALSITLRTDEGREYTLELLRSYPTAAQPAMGVIDAGGRHAAAYSEGLHYQGAVAGTAQSIATMSVFANGEVMILFAAGESNFVLGRLEDGSGKYILYNDAHMRSRPYMPCGVKDVPGDGQPGAANTAKSTNALVCNKVRIYWEVVYNLYTNKGSLTATQNYITGLFNQVQAMYANEHIAIELATLYIWTVQDDYPTASSSAALDRFRNYWNVVRNGFDGDIAMLLTRDNSGNGGGNGGLAYLDVLCNNRSYAYGYADIYGTYSTVPTYSWDVEVISHETGHNFGSQHTHWCGWNTGTGGACGAIDNCYTLETGSGCTTCGSTYSNAAATTAWKGTVMSYCHLVSRGISLANGFGPLPGALIRSKTAAGSCLGSIINAKLTPTPICTGNGAVTLTFPSNNFGTPAYSFNWTGNVHSQSLGNLSTPGTYYVAVSDSNGCSANFSADVVRSPGPGNGIAPTLRMPLCCVNTGTPLVLTAGAPQSLTGCESVYWLRSRAAFASLAEAQTYFDTASADNVLKSANDGSISSTTAATLSVDPPVNCAVPVTYYYTPVAVIIPHAADSFVTSTTAASTTFQSNSVQIGGYINLPDQSAGPTECDLLDTPSARSLSVTVSNYTGRANNLRIVVVDIASGTVVYQRFGLAGNGTYLIPGAAIRGNMLNGLQVIAMDYNCTNTACSTAVAKVSASRRVVYDTRTAKATPGCAPGTPIRVDWAATGCTKLDVAPAAALATEARLYPNPASASVSLQFTTQRSGMAAWKVSDMLGKTVLAQEAHVGAGGHEQTIDVRNWAKGVYFITLSGDEAIIARMKLVVE